MFTDLDVNETVMLDDISYKVIAFSDLSYSKTFKRIETAKLDRLISNNQLSNQNGFVMHILYVVDSFNITVVDNVTLEGPYFASNYDGNGISYIKHFSPENYRFIRTKTGQEGANEKIMSVSSVENWTLAKNGNFSDVDEEAMRVIDSIVENTGPNINKVTFRQQMEALVEKLNEIYPSQNAIFYQNITTSGKTPFHITDNFSKLGNEEKQLSNGTYFIINLNLAPFVDAFYELITIFTLKDLTSIIYVPKSSCTETAVINIKIVDHFIIRLLINTPSANEVLKLSITTQDSFNILLLPRLNLVTATVMMVSIGNKSVGH